MVIDMTQASCRSHQDLSALLQGVPATLCASIILINPIAKLALTMEPVAAATTAAVAQKTAGQPQNFTLTAAMYIGICLCFTSAGGQGLNANWKAVFPSVVEVAFSPLNPKS